MWSKKLTLQILILVFLVTIIKSHRPKTESELVSLVTRREWFAKNNVDYMLSLNAPTGHKAHVDIGPVSFGESPTLNLFVSINAPSYAKKQTLFHAYRSSDSSGQQNFKVTIKDANTFSFELGNKAFDIAKASRTTAHVDDEDWDKNNPSLQANTWNHINIDFINSGSSVTVNVHVNKRHWNQVTVNGAFFTDGFRDNAYLGAGWNKNSLDFENNFIGFLDNFALIGKSSTASWRKSCRDLPFAIDSERINYVQLLLDFNDALVSIGTTTVAITKTEKPDVFWVVAELRDGASFIPRSKLENWFECKADGDPHGYKRDWPKESAFSRIVNLEDQPGGKVFVRCGGDPGAASNASELEIRTYTRYTYWWRWAVYRLIAVRYIDYIYRINLDELTTGIDHPTYGHITPKLNIPQGVYRKHISAVNWDPIPKTKSLVYNLEPTTGAQYAHYDGVYLVVQIPGMGNVKIHAPEGVWTSCRYMNIEVRLNNDLCPKIKRGRSTCDDDLNINADPLYRDWLPPPPLPDVAPSKVDPCSPSLVDPSFKDEALNICKRIYPSDNDKLQDCLFDACAAGDIEVILVNRPTPECLLKSLNGDTTLCPELVCPNFCSFRGICDTTLSQCVCDAGYVGKDCGQKESFSCYDLRFGGETIKVSSQYAPASHSASAHVLQKEFFEQYAVEGSALLYTTYNNNGSEYLFVINNHVNGPNSGSYKLCITPTTGSIGVVQDVKKTSLGSHTVANSSPNCYSFTWGSFGSGGLIIELLPTSGQLSLQIEITDGNGLEQVLYASPNGKGDLDVTKIPTEDQKLFNLDLSTCQAQICAQYDQQCSNCSAQPACGYCVESGRCMLGDKSGPHAGVCNNWRYSFEESVSRVVTVEYDNVDLVHPDTEVFLTSLGGPEEGVPVNIYVPTLIRSYSSDALLLFSTQGDFASNAQQIKRNFANLLGPLASDNLNLGIGFYDDTQSKLTLSLTRVDPNNFFTFTRAMDAVVGNTGSGHGGQDRAIGLASSSTSVSVGFREHSKKFAFITVYGHNPAEKANILAQRDNVLNAGFTPIWVIVGNNETTRNFFQNEIIQDPTSNIPGFVLPLQNDASDLHAVIRHGIRIGSSFPSVVIKNVTENNHVDFSSIHPETLFISGLSDPGLRAWFRIPMKRGDTLNHVASIVVPGFGKSIIADVGNTKPIAKPNTFIGDENTPCLQISLIGSSYKNLLPVIFYITSAPVHGKLYQYDTSRTNNVGDLVTVGGPGGVSDGTASQLCYVPNLRFFHGEDKFTFKTYDGCSQSEDATISVVLRDINLTPLAEDTSFTLQERQNSSFSTFFKCTGGDDGETIHIFVNDIVIDAPDFVKPVDSHVLYVDGNLVTPNFVGAHSVPVLATGYEMPVDATFQYSSPFFFGKITFKYQCVDDTGLSSDIATSVVNVQQVFDAPVITLKEYTPIEDVLYEVKFSVRDFDVPIGTIQISEDSAIQQYSLYSDASGTTKLSLPYNCYQGTTDYTATCSLFFKLDNQNENSCPSGNGNCDINSLLRSVSLKVTAFDTQTSPLSTDSLIELYVYPVNDPPVLSLTNKVSTPEFTPVEFEVTLTDPDGDYLTTAYDLVITNPSSFFSASIVNVVPEATKTVFTVRVDPVFNIYGVETITIEGYDTITYSTSYPVEVEVTYVNDPPVVVIINKTLIEDADPTLIDITLADPDNTPDELTYHITFVPEIDGNPKYEIFDENGYGPLDLSQPLPGPKITVKPYKDYFTTIFDEITFTVTDISYFPALSPARTVQSTIRIDVTGVNDPPTCIKPTVVTAEDVPVVFNLLGAQKAYGEQGQPFNYKLVKNPFALNNATDQGSFYFFDSRVYSLSVSDFLAIATPINDGDLVPDGILIYVPPKDKNSFLSDSNPLRARPYFQFLVTDGLESDICEVVIGITAVNDAPVAWGNPWPGREDVSYLGINPITNAFEKPSNGECTTLCKGLEDTPLNLYLGGQDVDNVPSTQVFNNLKFELTSAGCPAGTLFQYSDQNSNIVTVTLDQLPYTLDKNYQAGLLHSIKLIPAPDTFNAPDPEFIHENVKYSELYCTLEYKVLDSAGAKSASQFIDISIQEENDLPNCTRPGCLFLEGSNRSNVKIIYNFQEVEMYEDEILWLHLIYSDVENDTTYPYAMECDPDHGTFYFPSGASQANAFLADGTILNQTELNLRTSVIRRCLPFAQAPPIYSFFSSVNVNGKGYYVKFVPEPNQFGNLYNKLGVLVVDRPTGNEILNLFYYFITVLPVNDYPEIYLTSYNAASPAPVLAQNNGQVSFTTFVGQSIMPINNVNDIDIVAGDPSLTVDIRPLYSNAAATIVVKDENGDDATVISAFRYTGSLIQVNRTLINLKFESSSVGSYSFDLLLNDNGGTGNCLPSEPQQTGGVCARETKIRVVVNVAETNSISGPLSFAAASGLGAFLIAGLVTGAALIKKYKQKKSDGWKEFDEDNFKDYGQSNPLFEQKTRSMSSPIYVSSAEEQSS